MSSKTTRARTSAADSFHEIATLRIDLVDSDPLIWRELEIPTSITLKVLHDIVQIAMGWFDSHLWEFRIGDGWEHRLTVTQVRPGAPDVGYPRYIAGKWNGPPEDCGGIPGFYAMLEARADPAHPDHDEIAEWLDGYDPKEIDELPLKIALGRIANRRNAARKRIAKTA